MKPIKLKPAVKDYIWGGTRLRDEYGIKTDLNPVAEAWVLSCHKDGESIADGGEFHGMTLTSIIEKCGLDILGEKAKQFDFFPILVKLIDAKGNLSIQVHPSDEYALEHEGQYGKTEMWYVVDCDEGASLYYGFKEKISKEEFKARIENDTILEVLNKVPVQKGDCFFIESGTIHAIGEGLLIAEIQQNSNLTYRVYDYGRVGADGKPRELHIEKALKVTTLNEPTHKYGKLDTNLLAECKYFTSEILELQNTAKINVTSDSFVNLLCLEGEGQIDDVKFKKGESIFIPAGLGELELNGNAKLILSKV